MNWKLAGYIAVGVIIGQAVAELFRPKGARVWDRGPAGETALAWDGRSIPVKK